MDRSKRIFFLLLINLTLVVLSLYILDFLQIIDYRQLIKRVPLIKSAFEPRIEDPLLLEKVELEKKWELLSEQYQNYSNDLIILNESQLELELAWDELEEEQENVQTMIDNFELEQEKENAYDLRVEQIAEQIQNLPPEIAVEVLEKQEDLMIADIFEKLEELADEAGTGSVVPGISMLMDPEQLANVHLKMLQE